MARSKSKNVGLIGLGIIGTRVAGALRKKNLRVYVWNRTPKPEQNFLGSPPEVAELCDLVQIFVSDDEALLDIIRLLSPGLTAQHIVTAHSTVSPETIRTAAELVHRRGARFLDAPFTGSKVAAEKGQLVYYIGGDEAALQQARPILEASSKEIVHLGEIGDATVMKVATNIVTAATAQVAAEALALLRKAGISPELFTRAMKNNATNSVTLEMKVPMMLAGDFEPHFSVKHMLKDVRIAAKLARDYSLDLPVTEVAGDMLLDEMKRGRGDADYASVAQKYLRPGEALVRPIPPPPAALSVEPVPPLRMEPSTPPPEPVAPPTPVTSSPPPPALVIPPPPLPKPVVETSSPPATEIPKPPWETALVELPYLGPPAPKENEEAPFFPPEPAAKYELPVPVLSSVETDASEESGLAPVAEEKAAAKVEPVGEKFSGDDSTETASEKIPAKEPIPEGINLSGGLRSWFSRRVQRSRERGDAGAL